MEQKLTQLNVTENQIKVIKDKYIKDSPTIESWLRGVAKNIALSEILYSNKISELDIFKNVQYERIDYDFNKKLFRFFLIHKNLRTYPERMENFKKFMKNLYDIAEKNPELIRDTEEKFYNILSNFEFLPNSPCLMNAGRDLQMLSACFVLPVEDSIDGIFDSVKNAAMVHKAGGGTGFSFSRLRPNGDQVMTTKGISSGPITFMKIFDTQTKVIKQGSTRRGANMGVLHYTHPDILEFMNMKKTPGVMENFNVSVTVDEKFMQAVKNKEDYDLINPKDKKSVGTLNAKEVWNELIKGAWETGDPGIIFIDRMNNPDSNPTPAIGQIETTNPCVTGDTLISTEKGLMRMENLVENYSDGGIKIDTDSRVPIEIKQRDGSVMLMEQSQENLINFDLITKAFTTGIKEVYRIRTRSGYELECTEDHKLFTNKGWVKLKDLDLNEHSVYIQNGEGKFNEDFKFNTNFEKIEKLNLPNEWSKELGQVMGWLIGDGWLREGKNCRVGFTFGKDDRGVMDYLKPIINNYYNNDINEIKRENGVYHLSYHSKPFVEFFKELGVKPYKAGEKIVPESIFTAPTEVVIGFLQGLFTADRTVSNLLGSNYYIRLTSKSEKLLKGVQLLLLNLGMKSRIYNRDRETRKIFPYVNKKGENKIYLDDGKCFELNISRPCVIKFLDKIGFLFEKNKNKTKIFYEKNLYKNKFEERISKIEFLGEKKVYDLTEPRTLSFITNGFLSLDCGEQPLLSYEVCNLGSINLSKFINKTKTDFDWERLKQCVLDTTHFLDNVIDINNYPIIEIEEMAKINRRIGLGVMGWAESIAMLNIPYNSKEALLKAEELMKFINENSLKTSEELAKERGVFPAFKDSVYDKDGRYFVKEKEAYPRNCARSTIAPTGTIAITAGLQGSGIEPFFSIVYVRYNAAALDALKKGETPNEKDVFFEANPIFEEIAKQNNYFGLSKKELYEKINDNHKSLKGIKEIPEKIQNRFLTSHDLTPEDHIMMQCAFQKYVDNAVSKTVNMRNESTIEDVEKVYWLAYNNGAKGVTVYRDGSKSFQVLNLSDKKKEEKKKELPEFADYQQIQTGQGPMHVHINYNEEGPTRVFANLSPAGTEISGLTTATAILLSKYFELGGDPLRILKHLNSIKSEKPYGFGKNRVDSIPHALSVALRKHLIKTGKIKTLDSIHEDKKQQKLVEESIEPGKRVYCSQCFSSNVGMVSGCSEPTCFDCGYSKCS